MERSKQDLAVLAMLVLVGVGAIVRFSLDVRIVQVVGLSGGARHAAPRWSASSGHSKQELRPEPQCCR